MSDYTISITEEERQMILMALAHLAVERPGWQFILAETAKKMDNIQGQMSVKRLHLEALKGQLSDIKVNNGRPVTFELFRIMHCRETSAIMDYVKAIVTAADYLSQLLPATKTLDEGNAAQSPGAPESD